MVKSWKCLASIFRRVRMLLAEAPKKPVRQEENQIFGASNMHGASSEVLMPTPSAVIPSPQRYKQCQITRQDVTAICQPVEQDQSEATLLSQVYANSQARSLRERMLGRDLGTVFSNRYHMAYGIVYHHTRILLKASVTSASQVRTSHDIDI